MKNNILPIKKDNRFPIYLGEPGAKGVRNQVGIAFIRPGSPTMRLKLYMFPKEDLFLITTDDARRFRLVSLDARETKGGEARSYWNQVGVAERIGAVIRLNFHLIEKSMYVSLGENEAKPEVRNEVA